MQYHNNDILALKSSISPKRYIENYPFWERKYNYTWPSGHHWIFSLTNWTDFWHTPFTLNINEWEWEGILFLLFRRGRVSISFFIFFSMINFFCHEVRIYSFLTNFKNMWFNIHVYISKSVLRICYLSYSPGLSNV